MILRTSDSRWQFSAASSLHLFNFGHAFANPDTRLAGVDRVIAPTAHVLNHFADGLFGASRANSFTVPLD
jgi:hypothetical protein